MTYKLMNLAKIKIANSKIKEINSPLNDFSGSNVPKQMDIPKKMV